MTYNSAICVQQTTLLWKPTLIPFVQLVQSVQHHLFRNVCILGIGVLCILCIYSVHAAPPKSLVDNATGAMCGGWIPFETKNFPSVDAFIATVSGVPGRDGDPLGNKRSGMAKRIENGGIDDGPLPNTGFQFPDTVEGYSTACRPGGPPFFAKHPCQRPGPAMNGQGVPIYEDTGGVQWTCDALCFDLNRRWHYLTWDERCDFEDDEGVITRADSGKKDRSNCFDEKSGQPAPTGTHTRGKGISNCAWEKKRIFYCCSNGLVATEAPGEVVPPNEPPNCVLEKCFGDDCRQELETLQGYTTRGGLYKSYYRSYEGSCQRSAIPKPYVEEDDHERINVPVSCYGMYDEYDPKSKVSKKEDFSCVIANTYPDADHDFVKMKTTQRSNMAAIDYGQIAKWADPPESDFEPERITSNIWNQQNGGFSLVNEEALIDQLDGDLTYALFGPDGAALRAYPQLTMEQSISTGGLLRAFDDTVSNERGDHRTLVEWWQSIQSEINAYLAPPSLRIILPAPWVLGLDNEDPLLLEESAVLHPMQNAPESVEVILQAKEDLLGEVAAYLERSQVLQVQEEEIPIIMPLVSAVELRALSDAWCAWHMEKSGDQNCENAPENVSKMRDRLDAYATYSDMIRKLRAELYYIESSVLERQEILHSVLTNWLIDTAENYNSYISSLDVLSGDRARWQSIQNKYRDFHDTTNFPWCMNDRFTVPIYSMLDYNWFPGRPNLIGVGGSTTTTSSMNALPFLDVYLPKVDGVNEHDVVVDFSQLYTYADSLRIPVLKPIQIRLDWGSLVPPPLDMPVPEPPAPLPDITTIHHQVQSTMPRVDTSASQPRISLYIPDAVLGIDSMFFLRVNRLITEMEKRYKSYWASLLWNPEEVTDGTEEDCISPDSQRCVHVEMDLRERFQRMCARPAILLKEDFDVIGYEWRNPNKNDYDSCDPKDWACQILFRNTTQGRKGWWLQYPKEGVQENIVGGLRRQLFEKTVLQEGSTEEERIRYIVKPAELFPSFNVPTVQSPSVDIPQLSPHTK